MLIEQNTNLKIKRDKILTLKILNELEIIQQISYLNLQYSNVQFLILHLNKELLHEISI